MANAERDCIISKNTNYIVHRTKRRWRCILTIDASRVDVLDTCIL